VATIDEIGDAAGWRCWVCDLPVEPDRSVNDDRGPSLDRCDILVRPVRGKKAAPPVERLAHRACNTKKGATKPVLTWPEGLLVFDAAPIIATGERLLAKGGREVVGRCATRADATDAAAWVGDRLCRLVPDVEFTTRLDEGGGQFLVSVLAPRP
jgi:hypothetical protein